MCYILQEEQLFEQKMIVCSIYSSFEIDVPPLYDENCRVILLWNFNTKWGLMFFFAGAAAVSDMVE